QRREVSGQHVLRNRSDGGRGGDVDRGGPRIGGEEHGAAAEGGRALSAVHRVVLLDGRHEVDADRAHPSVPTVQRSGVGDAAVIEVEERILARGEHRRGEECGRERSQAHSVYLRTRQTGAPSTGLRTENLGAMIPRVLPRMRALRPILVYRTVFAALTF